MPKTIPEHLRVPWGIKDALGVFVLAWIGLPVLIVLSVKAFAPYAPLAATFLKGLQNGSVQASFALVLIDAVAALGMMSMYLRRYDLTWRAVGWRRFSIVKAILLLVAIFLVFTLGISLLLHFVSVLDPSFNADQPQTNDFTGSAGTHPSITLLALVIIPPIIEESVFRGFIFPAFAKRFGVIFGAVFSSVLFGLAHLQANVSLYTFVLGLLLCFMYVRLRSIIPGIGLHMLNNYLAYIALAGK